MVEEIGEEYAERLQNGKESPIDGRTELTALISQVCALTRKAQMTITQPRRPSACSRILSEPSDIG